MKKIMFLLLPILIYANDEKILLKSQQDILDTKKKIIQEQKSIDKKSWLSDINLNASTSKNQDSITTNTIGLSYEQNIFKFGGIWYSIDLASLQEQYDLLGLHVSYKEFLNTIYKSIIDIKIGELNIRKTKLEIQNKTIAIKIKQDEYKEGQTDIITLNDKIIEKSTLEKNLVTLEIALQKNLDELKKYTSISYDKIKMPKLRLLKLDDYLKQSDQLNLANQYTKITNLNYKIQKTDFLPKLSFSLGGGYQDIDESKNDGKYYNYGLKVSMPFDFSFSQKIEKKRLNYLLSEQEKTQTKINETIKFKKIAKEVKKYKSLIDIANKDIALYAELLEVTNEEYKAGYKAKEDVQILSNTKTTRELDVKLNEFYIQQQILELYFWFLFDIF